MRPKKQVVKDKKEFTPEEIVPISPSPYFKSNTVNIRISRGGFMDDRMTWHKAPKRNQQPWREAVRLNGIWYWSTGLRDKNENMLVPNDILYAKSEKLVNI